MFEGLEVIPDYDEPAESDLLIRQSTIESMMLCPAKVGYSFHEDYDHTPSEPMFFGTVMHAVLEEHVRDGGPLHLHQPDYVETIIEKEAIDDGFDLSEVTNPVYVAAMAAEAVHAYQAWLTQWWAKKEAFFEPLVIEERLVRPLGTLPNGRAVWVHGTPDIGQQSGMTDWKTAGRGWKPGKGEVRIQSPTYLWLMEDIRGVREGLADYVVYDRSKQRWSSHLVSVSDTQVDAALKTLWTYARAIDAQVFPPTPSAPAGRSGRGWWCSAKYCGAWDPCEFKGLIADDVDLLEIRTSNWS